MAEKAGIYARVSTDEQAERETIENQLYACRAYCARNGYEVVGEFCDEVVSRSLRLADRPQGARLLAMASEGLFTRTIVSAIDRLGAGGHGILAVEKLRELGAPVFSLREPVEDTPSGRMTTGTAAVFAEYERELIRERTMSGRARRVRSGKYQASITPYGYQMIRCGERGCKHPECGRLRLDPETAPIVRQIFEWAKSGDSVYTIAAKLDEARTLSPSSRFDWREREPIVDEDGTIHPLRPARTGWSFTSIHHILHSKRYIGQQTYGDGAAKLAMALPPLVSAEVFNAVQEALKKRKRTLKRNTKRFYLLQHLLWCRCCGKRYTALTPNWSHDRAQYQCWYRGFYGKKAGHEGTKWNWWAAELDARVKDAVKGIYLDPARSLAEVDLQVERLKDEVSQQGQAIARLEEKLQRLSQERERAITDRVKGYTNEADLVCQLTRITKEQEEAQGRLDSAREVAKDADLLTEAADWFRELCEALPMADHFVDAYGRPSEPTDEEWAVLIRNVVDKIWIENDGSITLDALGVPVNAMTRSRPVVIGTGSGQSWEGRDREAAP